MDSMNWTEHENRPNQFKTIGDLDKNEPIDGSHVILTKAEIPQDESVIYLNPGHAKDVPFDMVKPSDLYYEEKKAPAGYKYHTVHVAIKIDELVKNKMFKESGEAKDVLFEFIYQQLGQTSHSQRLGTLKALLEMKKKTPNNPVIKRNLDESLNSIEALLTRDYNQAKAAQRVLEAAGNYPTTKRGRELTREQVNRILKPGSLEKQLTVTKEEIKKITEEAA